MIDPFNIGWDNPDQSTIQEFMLFCTFVKNKPAATISKKLEAFLYELCVFQEDGSLPALELLKRTDIDYVEELLRKHKLSPYEQNLQTLNFLMWDKDLWQTGAIDPLLNRSFFMRIPGWSYKTASFFKLLFDPNWAGCVIDTHVRKFMTFQGLPWSTSYELNETHLLAHWARYCRDRLPSLRQFDTYIWQQFATTPTHA